MSGRRASKPVSCGGGSSSTMIVMRIAITPSLNASIRLFRKAPPPRVSIYWRAMLSIWIVSALLLAAPAAAPAPAPAPPAGFDLFYEGKQFGDESVETKVEDGVVSIHGHVSGTLPSGTTLILDHVTKLSKDRTRAVEYTARLAAPGGALD